MLRFFKKWAIAALAPSMRSPSGITGWFARRMMRAANTESTRFAIRNRMHLKASDVFVELGGGEGAGLRAVMGGDAGDIPSRMHLMEISDDMRSELERVVREDLPAEKIDGVRVDVHGEDCRSMPYLDDDSVDSVFAMNVVYFLDPLPEYLKEIHRVLKPGTGHVVWGCKFDKVPKDNEVFVNVHEDKVIQMMMDAGFEVTSEAINVAAGIAAKECSADDASADNSVENDMRNYIEIRGRKVQ